MYTLTGPDGTPYRSERPGTLGGHARTKVYGRLDCPVGVRNSARGHVRHRVFFADEATAIAAGFRPCAVCMPTEYRRWKTSETATGRVPR